MWSRLRPRSAKPSSLLPFAKRQQQTLPRKCPQPAVCRPQRAAFISFSSSSTSPVSRKFPDGTDRPRRKKKSELLLARTHRVLQSKSWIRKDWEIAEGALFAWTRQPIISSQSVELAFALLDRMVLEAERTLKVVDGISNNQRPPFAMSTKHINIVLDRWRIGARQGNHLSLIHI